jgi:hypothetical protein
MSASSPQIPGAAASWFPMPMSSAEGALLSALGIVIQEEGDLDRRARSPCAGGAHLHELGSRHREGSALYYLGTAFLERGLSR